MTSAHYQLDWPRENLIVRCFVHDVMNYRYHWHEDDYELSILLHGTQEYCRGNKNFLLRENDIILTAPGIGHCPIHPIRKINWRHSGPTDYCADMSVALHYYNAADKWNDDHSLLGLGFEKLLDSPAQTVAQRWPRQCNAIRTCLDRLTQLEAEGSEDLDAVSGCFGELMAELFDYKQDHWSPELRSIGFHLGKFIYLLDAYDDLARDEKKGAYNPLRTLSRQPGYEEEMREIFELLLARCARSFERLPCVEDADLLRNILYSGVWLKYNCKQAKETRKK